MNKLIVISHIICLAIALSFTQVQASTDRSDQSADKMRNTHPLDPLTVDEIRTVVEFLFQSKKATKDTRFALIELSEPSKREVIKNQTGINRQAYVLMYDWKKKSSFEAVVNIKGRKLASWQKLKTGQPPNTYLIVERIEEIVFKDPRWQKAMLVRNLKNHDVISLWPDLLPYQRLNELNGKFIIPVMALNNNPSSAKARYLNIDIQVNLSDGKIVKFIDNEVETKQAQNARQLIPKQSSHSEDPAFYQAGRNFEINGSHLSWENWRFHFSVNPRRGLEIYDVKYVDNGRERNILYRASLSEIVTPYGDPAWYSWYPSDEGDLNFSNYALVPTTENDVLPNTVFRPAIIHDAKGNTKTIQRSVAIYEKYSGLRWRHYQESRRAKDLVLSSHFMVDNYDYVASWVFKQNGSIVVEVTLTGMINYGLTEKQSVEPGELKNTKNISNTLVAPGVFGPVHQHYFNYRLDFDIDGSNNTAAEVNFTMLPKEPNNPNEEWFASTTTIFNKEKQAMRQISPNTSRKWKISNSNKTNQLGQKPSYFIIPKDNTFPLPGVNSKVRKKAGFINTHFWVTPYSRKEMYAAGKYLGADYTGEGLPKWVQANRDIKNKDIVVWYTLGITHMPRPEDWPVMPSRTISFEIMPFGFFTENPALD